MENQKVKLFLSYSFDDVHFVGLVYKYLAAQPKIDPFFYTHKRNADRWTDHLREELNSSQAFVIFVGKKIGKIQYQEFSTIFSREDLKSASLWVKLCDDSDTENQIAHYRNDHDPIRLDPAKVADLADDEALKCAKEIVRRFSEKFSFHWIPPEDIPDEYLFAYERYIIEAYINDSTEYDLRIPHPWPDVAKVMHQLTIENPVPEEQIGKFREPNDSVVVSARGDTLPTNYTFLEAGPRKEVCYPNLESNHPERLNVGILVSGGIAPGINAVIDSIVSRHQLYAKSSKQSQGLSDTGYELNVFGFLEGFKSLLRGAGNHIKLTESMTKDQVYQGGSMLGTSRAAELLNDSPETRHHNIRKIIATLEANNIEILYVIGGDGTMRAAHAIWTIARHEKPELNLSVVTIPKTTDNDILWCWQSFGFLSAVEKARETILLLETEVTSNPRLCIIQLFGSDSGFVVAHAALASGVCDYALIPEDGFRMDTLCNYLEMKLRRRLKDEQKSYAMIVMSETAIPSDFDVHIDIDSVSLTDAEKTAIRKFIEDDRRVHGQTPDELRSGGLKLVSKILQEKIQSWKGDSGYWDSFRVFTNEPRQLIRAIPPSAADVIYAQRLGTLAVDNAMAGYTDFMVSQWLTEFVLVPLKLVVLGRKRVAREGIFWKSVLASTGQPREDSSSNDVD